mmetsp:Transcript_26991/g.77009  ORF Transcript_26991/g.77009 Transcript_26991/m.77009 type:complete len:200 (-) Transcript_26991:1757-2356(-)
MQEAGTPCSKDPDRENSADRAKASLLPDLLIACAVAGGLPAKLGEPSSELIGGWAGPSPGSRATSGSVAALASSAAPACLCAGASPQPAGASPQPAGASGGASAAASGRLGLPAARFSGSPPGADGSLPSLDTERAWLAGRGFLLGRLRFNEVDRATSPPSTAAEQRLPIVEACGRLLAVEILFSTPSSSSSALARCAW